MPWHNLEPTARLHAKAMLPREKACTEGTVTDNSHLFACAELLNLFVNVPDGKIVVVLKQSERNHSCFILDL
jgi:hypothetical protein